MLSGFLKLLGVALLGTEIMFGVILTVIRTHRAVLVSLKFSGSSWLTVSNQTLL